MVLLVAHLALALLAASARAAQFRLSRQDRNNGIHLAVSPVCGPLSGDSTDANAGIDLGSVKTIVAFGVSHGSIAMSCTRRSLTIV